MLDLLFMFLTSKSRKLSFKFFESINELREFVNRGYNFYNYNNEEKISFIQFLIKLAEGVMINSKLQSLDINVNKEVINIDDIKIGSGDTDDFDTSEISLNDYRKSAEDVFYNIFVMFIHNFKEEGGELFFQWINKLLTEANVNDPLIVNDLNRLLVVEVVLNVVKSTIECFEVETVSHSYINQFIRYILKSQLLNSQNFIYFFLLFLDTASSFINKDTDVMMPVIELLINTMSIRYLESISARILQEIALFNNVPNVNAFNVVYNVFKERYDSLQHETLCLLTDYLCNMVGILDKSTNKIIQYDPSELSQFYKAILVIPSERISKVNILLDGISTNDLAKIKYEFLKAHSIYHNVLKTSYFLDKKLLRSMFSIFMNDIQAILPKIFTLFLKDNNVIKETSKTFTKAIHHLGEESILYFDYINELFLRVYIDNPDNFYVLNVYTYLYPEAIKNSKEKKDYIATTFMDLCDLVCKNIHLMRANQVDTITAFAQVLINVFNVNELDYLVVKPDSFNAVVNLFLDAVKSVSEPTMNRSVLKAISNIISSPRLISPDILVLKFEEIVYHVFSSCDHFDSGSIIDVSNTLT
jgi:hypothetical protein